MKTTCHLIASLVLVTQCIVSGESAAAVSEEILDSPAMAAAMERRALYASELDGASRSNAAASAELKLRLSPELPRAIPSFRFGNTNQEARTKVDLRQRQGLGIEIKRSGDGARASAGRHAVRFAPNVLDREAVELATPDGAVLKSRVLGLCYIDYEAGESVLIAEPKYSVGQIVPGGRIIYSDAFDTAAADILYTYTRRSLEQDIIIRKQLPAPGDLGMTGANVYLAVMTEFLTPVSPKIAIKQGSGDAIDLDIADEEIGVGRMRIVEGKAFTLGDDPEPIPVKKQWRVIEGRQFLIESVLYRSIAPKLAALPRYGAIGPQRPSGSFERLMAGLGEEQRGSLEMAQIQLASRMPEEDPGVVLDYLIVDQALLNINFNGYKYGYAAIGQENWDYWNTYDNPGVSVAALPDLEWSDLSGGSDVGIIVSNAPATGYYAEIEDTMYRSFVFGSNSSRLTVTITNLPSDLYDILVYAPRTPSNGVPVVELKRNGTSLWIKNFSHWGNGWFESSYYGSPWQEHEQYVRFRDITVTNQTLRLEVIPDSSGLAVLSGIQIVPSGAVPPALTNIVKLMNVDTVLAESNKVGFAAIGITSSDKWNNYSQGGSYAGMLSNLKWSDDVTSSVGFMLRNAPGQWGVALPDVMFRSYGYSWNQGNVTGVITNLPTGTYDFLFYGHPTTTDDNGIFELWSDEVNWGVKGTSLHGYGHTSNRWELGQQYVQMSGVAVVSNRPIYFQAKKNGYGYNNLSGFQIARTGDLDSDEDGLPDAWEMKWFATLGYYGEDDFDSDGLTNLREYQLNLIPTRQDSDGDTIIDAEDNEFPWLDDNTPQGAILYGTSETWNWQTSWYDGVGWGGATITPYRGNKFHISANVSGAHQHYFERALGVMRAKTGDVFYAYINLDSTYTPTEVMLQFYVMESNGSFGWDHRAYWGANNISWGVNNTDSRRPMGALPTAGQWVRLEVPASAVGLEGRIVEGMAFTLYDGRAAWDSAGIFQPDMDGDSLPDAWEVTHFGNLGQSGGDDPDGDGFTNLQEYLNETDPNKAHLSIKITHPKAGGNLP